MTGQLPSSKGFAVRSFRFEQLTEEFLAYQRIYSDDRKTSAYNISILKRLMGHVSVDRIGPPEVEAMIAARLDEGVARSTINRQRATLSRFMEWAISRKHHPGPNPVRQVKKFRESRGRTRYLTPDESDRLIIAASPHLKPLIMMALHTGGRMGELLALRWMDIDRGVIYFRCETTKSRKERVVPVDAELRAVLDGMRKGRQSDRVFQWRGRPIGRVRTAFLRARRRANLGRDVLFYTLRHSFASWAAMNGIDLYLLKEYMGHSTIALTQRYAHLSPEFIRAGVRYLGKPTEQHQRNQQDT